MSKHAFSRNCSGETATIHSIFIKAATRQYTFKVAGQMNRVFCCSFSVPANLEPPGVAYFILLKGLQTYFQDYYAQSTKQLRSKHKSI